MVEADKIEAFAHEKGQIFFFWFEKSIAFVRIDVSCDFGVKRALSDRISRSDCELDYEEKITFVGWYEALENKIFLLDKTDNALACVRPRWDRACWRRGHPRTAAKYGTVLIGLVRGLVHTVKREFEIDN